jgi:hypothetical protein
MAHRLILSSIQKQQKKINVQFQRKILIITKFGSVRAIYDKISKKYKNLSYLRSSSICGDHKLIDYTV